MRASPCYSDVYEQSGKEFLQTRDENIHPFTDAVVNRAVEEIYNSGNCPRYKKSIGKQYVRDDGYDEEGYPNYHYEPRVRERDTIESILRSGARKAIKDILKMEYDIAHKSEREARAELIARRKTEREQIPVCPACGSIMGRGHDTTEISCENRKKYPELLNISIFNYPRVCTSCYNRGVDHMNRVDEERRREEIRRMDEEIAQCEVHGTCGTFRVHHIRHRKDPERLRTSFMIGLTCGIDGLRLYLSKRGDVTLTELNRMTDEEVVECSDRFDAIRG